MSLFGLRCLGSLGDFVVQACIERGCLVSSFCEFVLRVRVMNLFCEFVLSYCFANL